MKDEVGVTIEASRRKRQLKWMPPTAVNVDDFDLPAVIRKVK